MDKFYRSFLFFFVLAISCAEVFALQLAVNDQVKISTEIKANTSSLISSGDVVDYTIIVKNDGDAEARNLVVQDMLSEGFIFMNASHAATIEDGTISWSIPSIPAGEEIQIMLTVMVTQQSGSVTNSVTVFGESLDQTLTAISKLSLDVVDLKLTQEVSNPVVNTGKPVVYKITVENASSVTASEVVLTDLLPQGLVYKEAYLSKGVINYDADTRVLTGLIESIHPHEKVILEIDAMAGSKGTLTNSARVISLEKDSNEMDNIASISHQQVDLFIPNTFTPNGDGRNDVWEIPDLLVSYPNNRLTIVNRWGVEIYKVDNYQNDWDGSNLAEGTYYYQLVGIGQGGVEEVYTGYLTLLR